MKLTNKRPVRWRFWSLSLILLLCMVAIGGSLVYASMVSRDQKTNDFQLGVVTTKIEEKFVKPSKLKTDEVNKKEVTVTNPGSIKQFVRVMIQPEIVLPASGNAIKQILPARLGKEIEIDLNKTDWVSGEDGYYYYLKALGMNETTIPLFKTVKLKGEFIQPEYQNAEVTILIKAETVTTAKFVYRDSWWQGQTPNSGVLKTIDTQLKSKAE